MNQNSKRGRAKEADEHAQKARNVATKLGARAIWTGWFLHADRVQNVPSIIRVYAGDFGLRTSMMVVVALSSEAA